MFVSRLQTQAQTCNFGDSLGDMLRHQLVCAINDNYIQPRLLSKPRLDFKKAMELALGLETAVKNARELQSSGREFASTEGVNKLDFGDSEAAKPCYHCGKMSHCHGSVHLGTRSVSIVVKRGICLPQWICCDGKGAQQTASSTAVGSRNGSSPGRKVRRVRAVPITG